MEKQHLAAGNRQERRRSARAFARLHDLLVLQYSTDRSIRERSRAVIKLILRECSEIVKEWGDTMPRLDEESRRVAAHFGLLERYDDAELDERHDNTPKKVDDALKRQFAKARTDVVWMADKKRRAAQRKG